MTNDDYNDILEHHKVKPTSLRMLILKTMSEFINTFSMTDLEDVLDTVDKSTIFRTLTLFAENHLIHSIDDGSGSTKYCVCHNDHECSADELHCHFYCEHCHKTFCLDHTHIPSVKIPKGFTVHEINYMMKGVCPECEKKGL